jgi:hypothetical protein
LTLHARSVGKMKNDSKEKKHTRKVNFPFFDMFLNINSNISNINISAKYKERREFPRVEVMREKQKRKSFPEFWCCQRDDLP